MHSKLRIHTSKEGFSLVSDDSTNCSLNLPGADQTVKKTPLSLEDISNSEDSEE